MPRDFRCRRHLHDRKRPASVHMSADLCRARQPHPGRLDQCGGGCTPPPCTASSRACVRATPVAALGWAVRDAALRLQPVGRADAFEGRLSTNGSKCPFTILAAALLLAHTRAHLHTQPMIRSGSWCCAAGVNSCYSYSRSRGLYLGVALEGSVFFPRDELNRTFYNSKVTSIYAR
jgi:hypothetical protein